tara:strand:- start:1011 stop:1400 length:390 start_codon:yes stop_codon:yes gene_type:complete
MIDYSNKDTKTFAIVKDGKLIKKIMLEKESDYSPETGETLVDIEGQNIKNGSSYDGTTFSYTPPGFTNEQNIKFLRDRRNDLLAKSDWTQGRDVTLSNDSAWQTYRQALRDLPSNTVDSSNPTWPTEPS